MFTIQHQVISGRIVLHEIGELDKEGETKLGILVDIIEVDEMELIGGSVTDPPGAFRLNRKTGREAKLVPGGVVTS